MLQTRPCENVIDCQCLIPRFPIALCCVTTQVVPRKYFSLLKFVRIMPRCLLTKHSTPALRLQACCCMNTNTKPQCILVLVSDPRTRIPAFLATGTALWQSSRRSKPRCASKPGPRRGRWLPPRRSTRRTRCTWRHSATCGRCCRPLRRCGKGEAADIVAFCAAFKVLRAALRKR